MQRWAVIGDLHLGKLSNLISNHLDLQFECIFAIMSRIKDEGIKTVVLLGDVFDQPEVENSLIIRLLRFFDKYSSIQFYWVCGNHDKTSTDETSIDLMASFRELNFVENLTIFLEPTRVNHVGFLPYPHKKPLPKTTLTFAHVDRPGARSDTGHLFKTKDGDDEWNEDHTFIIGHIHTPQKIGKTYYTGSPYQLSFGEKAAKHWAIIEFDKETFRYKRMPINLPYTLVNLHISSKKQLREIEKDSNTYYKLSLAPDFKLPTNFLIDHPNCSLKSGKAKKDLSEAIEQLQQSTEELEINLTFGLEKFLSEEKGLTEDEVKIALSMVEELVNKE